MKTQKMAVPPKIHITKFPKGFRMKQLLTLISARIAKIAGLFFLLID
ncbi:MAG: hypothetical protein ABIR06_07845 [Cyclobacteriaceae bacterium]